MAEGLQDRMSEWMSQRKNAQEVSIGIQWSLWLPADLDVHSSRNPSKNSQGALNWLIPSAPVGLENIWTLFGQLKFPWEQNQMNVLEESKAGATAH